MNIRILLAAALCAGTAHAQKITLKAADTQPAGYPTVVAVQEMGKHLEAATDGRLRIQMFAGGVLGQEKEALEQAQLNAIQLVRVSIGVLGPLVPEVDVFNLPFVFRDVTHMRKVIDGAIGDELLERITKSPARLVGLGWMDAGSRSLYTTRPVHNPAELKGLKIRVMGNPLFVDAMDAMGGNGISMAYGEVFGALQSGVIDGAENNPPSFYTANHFRTPAKFYAQTHHLIIPEVLVMSKVAWERLSAADQAAVRKAAREAQLEERALWDKSDADYTARLKAAHIQFVEVDGKAFRDATAPVRAKYGAKFGDMLERIEAVR